MSFVSLLVSFVIAYTSYLSPPNLSVKAGTAIILGSEEKNVFGVLLPIVVRNRGAQNGRIEDFFLKLTLVDPTDPDFKALDSISLRPRWTFDPGRFRLPFFEGTPGQFKIDQLNEAGSGAFSTLEVPGRNSRQVDVIFFPFQTAPSKDCLTLSSGRWRLELWAREPGEGWNRDFRQYWWKDITPEQLENLFKGAFFLLPSPEQLYYRSNSPPPFIPPIEDK